MIIVSHLSVSIAQTSEENTVFLELGKRLLVRTKGRKDYHPKIVNCETSAIDICLRDTRGNPANNPVEQDDDGNLRVTFASWGISYIIYPDGTGRTFNSEGKELKPFNWELK